MLEEVTQYFKQKLGQESSVYQYLINRGFTQESIEKFDIGYFPSVSDLLNYFDFYKLKEFGVVHDINFSIIQSRLIFPIRDLYGKVIAFAGRVLLSEQERKEKKVAKYINTSYVKSEHVYGLYYAKGEMRKKDSVIVTEGYPDVIIANQFGINNIVCSSGTAFSQHQISLLARYSTVFYLVFNPDIAGIKARDRAMEVLSNKKDIVVKQITLPFESDVKDIDNFLHKYGKENFLSLFEEKQVDNYFEQLMGQIMGVQI